MLYRYKKVITEHTTHYAEPPRDANGGHHPTWFEHCELDDGFTYVTCNVPPPPQNPIIDFAQVFPPAQYMQQIRERSPHLALVEQRVAKGLYMRADGKIVAGDTQTISAWRQSMLDMFDIGG